MRWSPPEPILGQRIRPMLEKDERQLHMSPSCQMQRSQPASVGPGSDSVLGYYISAVVEKGLCDFSIFLERCLVQLGPLVLALVHPRYAVIDKDAYEFHISPG
jgi:hypothetical protein